MSLLKKSFLTILLAVLVFSLTNAVEAAPPPDPYALTEEEKGLRDQALSFLVDVFKLNVSEYDLSQVITSPAPFEGVFMTLKLRSDESKLDVGTRFRNGELIWCTLYPGRGSPAFMDAKSSNVLSVAKNTLERLQAISPNKNYLPTVRGTLDTVTEVKDSTITVGNFTQEIKVSEDKVEFSWRPFAHGLSNQQNQLLLKFEDGRLMHYADYLGIYEIGSSEVNISEEEAIQIAMDQARAFSWEAGNETVSNVTVLDSPVKASVSLQNRGNRTLYPLWDIRLPLDQLYPGGITGFHVLLWADTGEVQDITPIGFYGNPGTAPSEISETNPTPTQNPTDNSSDKSSDGSQGLDPALVLVAGLVVSATVLLGAAVYIRKRKR